jgi:hypothetical protein
MPPQGRSKNMAPMNGLGPSASSSTVGELGNNAVARATEGWLELFLTPAEKHNFSQWNEIVKDHSLVHSMTGGYLDRLSLHYLPATLAPNVLTLSGFIMLGQAWYSNQ